MTFVDWFDKILEFFGSFLILYLGAIASVSAEKDFDSSTWPKDWCWQNGGKENLIEVIQSYLEDGRVLRPDLDDDDDQQDDGQDHHQDNAWRKVFSKKQLLFELMSLAFMKNGVTLTNTSYYSKMALMTTVTYDKKSGRVVDSRRVDSEGGSTFLLVVLGVLGTLNILFNMNICIWLLFLPSSEWVAKNFEIPQHQLTS